MGSAVRAGRRASAIGGTRGAGRRGVGKALSYKSWSRKALAAALACSGIALAKPAGGLAGRRAASIARVVKAYYLG